MKYDIDISETAYYYIFGIEAENEEEAGEKALRMVKDGVVEPDNCEDITVQNIEEA